jgi:hypothetical protein
VSWAISPATSRARSRPTIWPSPTGYPSRGTPLFVSRETRGLHKIFTKSPQLAEKFYHKHRTEIKRETPISTRSTKLPFTDDLLPFTASPKISRTKAATSVLCSYRQDTGANSSSDSGSLGTCRYSGGGQNRCMNTTPTYFQKSIKSPQKIRKISTIKSSQKNHKIFT